MPPRPLVFPALLIRKGVRQLFLTSFRGGATRTRVQRRMTSMEKITMAISRITADFISSAKFAQEKTDDGISQQPFSQWML